VTDAGCALRVSPAGVFARCFGLPPDPAKLQAQNRTPKIAGFDNQVRILVNTPRQQPLTNPGGRAMNDGPTVSELEERIAMIRQNIVDLVEQAAAYSGAGDEARTADRIAQQEQELAKLIALRDARSAK
jgi:hypothetical protein